MKQYFGSILTKCIRYKSLSATLKFKESACWVLQFKTKKGSYRPQNFLNISKTDHNFEAPGTGLKLRIF